MARGDKKASKGFTDEEKAAMRQRAREQKAADQAEGAVAIAHLYALHHAPLSTVHVKRIPATHFGKNGNIPLPFLAAFATHNTKCHVAVGRKPA